MKRMFASLSIIGLLSMVTFAIAASAATDPAIIFDSTPQPLPPNIASLGFQATSTDEFGDYIVFTPGANRNLSSVAVMMSAWGKQSEYPAMVDPNGWMHPITLNLYAVDHSGVDPALGTLIVSTTQTFLIPWRPEADPTCPGGTAWRAGDGACYNGLAFTIEFDMTGVTVPDEIIYGIAYNTQTHGSTPIGAPGPYNSLNVGLSTDSPSAGTDAEPDAVFWDTSHGPFYSDGGAGGVDTFRRDTGWAPYTPTIQFTATNQPPTTKDQCKNGGWATFNNPVFRNQGECVAYVNANN